ncbi:hypothetical protein Scep_004547 [Stephania cephalantha]|uniref:ATPase F1/V1/A1 complex alpha/beta subunit nucleotide-binding domain-containing protein n=1 Tax=Stephania cephalantha TaxID=152367 RepID=A0AAP0PVI6_9MAGN
MIPDIEEIARESLNMGLEGDFRVEQKTGRLNHFPKRDAAILKRQLSHLQTYLGGIKYMMGLPDIELTMNPLISSASVIAAGLAVGLASIGSGLVKPLQTELIAINYMIPIGYGQRELIIGDRQTGKTILATNTILNQKWQNVIYVYGAIGQKTYSVAQVVTTFQEQGMMEYTILVAEIADSFHNIFWGVRCARGIERKDVSIPTSCIDVDIHATLAVIMPC